MTQRGTAKSKRSGPNERDHCFNSKVSKEGQFGTVAASHNSQNLSGYSIEYDHRDDSYEKLSGHPWGND